MIGYSPASGEDRTFIAPLWYWIRSSAEIIAELCSGRVMLYSRHFNRTRLGVILLRVRLERVVLTWEAIYNTYTTEEPSNNTGKSLVWA